MGKTMNWDGHADTMTKKVDIGPNLIPKAFKR